MLEGKRVFWISKVFIVHPIIRESKADSFSASTNSRLRCGNMNGDLCIGDHFGQGFCWHSWNCALGPAQQHLSGPFLEGYLWTHGEPFFGQSLPWALDGVWLHADQLVLSCPVPKVFRNVGHPWFFGCTWSFISYEVCSVTFVSWNKRFRVNIYLQVKFANCFDRSKSEVFLIVLVVRAHPVLFTSVNCFWQRGSMWWKMLSSC